MKINLIPCHSISIPNNTIIHRYGLSYKSQFKYNGICFKSKDLIQLPEQEIFNKIKESLIPQNFLGQGVDAEVYKIKDTNYCVRIPYVAKELYSSNYSKDLTTIDKINHVVAKLGFGASIMHYFDGIIPKWYMNNSHNRYKMQEEIANMPIKSYSELLHQIAEAINNEMLFDFSPGNLIVDTKNQKLTAIDFFELSQKNRSTRPLTEIYSILTCYGSLEKTGKKIFDNIIDAGLEEFKPDRIPCMDIELFDFIDLVLKRNSENGSYRQGDIANKINRFNDLQYSIAENLRILKQLKQKEIMNKTIAKDLEIAIHNFKQIIKKIH